MSVNINEIATKYEKRLQLVAALGGFIHRVADNTVLLDAITPKVRSLFSSELIPDAMKISTANKLLAIEVKSENFKPIMECMQEIDGLAEKLQKKERSEVIKNSYLLAQGERDNTSILSLLPKDLLLDIASVTCDSQVIDTAEARKLADVYYGKPQVSVTNKLSFFNHDQSTSQEEQLLVMSALNNESHFENKKRGEWSVLINEPLMEIGINNHSGLRGIATKEIQILLSDDKKSLTVLDKQAGYNELSVEKAARAISKIAKVLNGFGENPHNQVNNNF